jgi:hypothetical protein
VLKILELKGVDAEILELVAVGLVRADVSDDAPKVLVLVLRDPSDAAYDDAPKILVLVLARVDVSDDAYDNASRLLVLVERVNMSDDAPKVLVLVERDVSDDAYNDTSKVLVLVVTEVSDDA